MQETAGKRQKGREAEVALSRVSSWSPSSMWQMKLEMKRGQTRKVPEHEAKETQTFFWKQQGGSKHLRMVTRYLASS